MGFISAPVDLSSPAAIGSTTPNTGAFTTLSANNGTLTSSSPAATFTQTWNNAAVTFTGFRASITDTASAAASLLMDLQVGGTSQFSVSKSGVINTPSSGVTINQAGIFAGKISYSSGCTLRGPFRIRAPSDAESTLTTDAADTLAQRNSTNAQTFRLYNTYTDASNYERGFFRWSSNILELGAEAAGTGTQRQLRFPLGTVTASTPLSITQTWNSSGVTFTGIQANITDTASASGSLLMDLQVGGSSKFSVTKAGALIINGNTATYDSGIFRVVNIRTDGNIRSDGAFQFGTTLELRADASDILAQRRSTNAQTFRLYRTFTDASNYERLGLLATNTTRYTITSQNAGTGSARSLEVSYYTSASDPTSTEITDGCFSVWKNSGTGTIKLWANDGGTMKSVALA